MTRIGSLESWRLGLVGVPVAAALLWLSFASPPHGLLILAFAAAVANVSAASWSNGEPATIDLALLLVVGFAASAYASASLGDEVAYAIGRMIFVGAAIAITGFTFVKLRGASPVGSHDAALLIILAAFLPLGQAIGALALSLVLSVGVFAVMRKLKGAQLGLRDQLPVGVTVPGIYFCIWLACRLDGGVAF